MSEVSVVELLQWQTPITPCPANCPQTCCLHCRGCVS